MSSVEDDGAIAALAGIVRLLESHEELSGELVTILKNHGQQLREQHRRLDELEEAWGDALVQLGTLTRRSRLIVNMKAATLTQTCLRCGNEYAKEAGPQLCGPCWIAEGRPERYLRPAEPA